MRLRRFITEKFASLYNCFIYEVFSAQICSYRQNTQKNCTFTPLKIDDDQNRFVMIRCYSLEHNFNCVFQFTVTAGIYTEDHCSGWQTMDRKWFNITHYLLFTYVRPKKKLKKITTRQSHAFFWRRNEDLNQWEISDGILSKHLYLHFAYYLPYRNENAP